MLLDQKYQPKTLDDIQFNRKHASNLKNFTLSTIPHLIVHGRPGCGKRTLVYAFINHLFGKQPKTHHRSIEVVSSSDKKITISYVESEEYVEICPSDYNFKDKDVIQDVIKKMAETKPILSLISRTKSEKLKLIVITKAEKMTKDAQAALRRTVETYVDNFRMIMICNDTTGIIDPIKSRMLCLRVTVASSDVLLKTLSEINDVECIGSDEKTLKQIISDSHGNFRRALFFLQRMQLNSTGEEKTKRLKKQEGEFKLEWETVVTDMVKMMVKEQSNTVVMNIRSHLNELLIKCIPPRLILKALFETLMSTVKQTEYHNLCTLTAKYDCRITLGTKSIFHLEAYVIAVMLLLQRK
ncbi:Replication factor C, subunit RFC3 [Trachipleistophora hominis]|uniref:Replication factor C, subunit RFC3 n=1 Tax=Trachipleistophora hominis TaxID=72359 RepID=L7JV06_TRAHO|nr:Replication factor C, subunit RFC3 [Trachipleistophora hominis]